MNQWYSCRLTKIPPNSLPNCMRLTNIKCKNLKEHAIHPETKKKIKIKIKPRFQLPTIHFEKGHSGKGEWTKLETKMWSSTAGHLRISLKCSGRKAWNTPTYTPRGSLLPQGEESARFPIFPASDLSISGQGMGKAPTGSHHYSRTKRRFPWTWE